MTKSTSIGDRGYTILKEEYSSTEINNIRKDLTVKPFINKNYISNANPFAVYAESKRKLYIPRFYGFKKFGEPTKYKINEGESIEGSNKFNGSLKEIQIPIVESYLNEIKNKYSGGGIISIPCGYGKCFAKGTPILMYNGLIETVENISMGDLLMGDDSKPRKVLSLGRGYEMMYKITPSMGDSYIVNESHILSLVKNPHLSSEKMIDITVKDYLELISNTSKIYTRSDILYGYSVPIEFPYIKPESSAQPYNSANIFINFIPRDFKCNSRNIQLDVLAGFIDKYGYISSYGGYDITVSEFINYNNEHILLDNILFIIRSLGFEYVIREYNGKKILNINGKFIHEIPVINMNIYTIYKSKNEKQNNSNKINYIHHKITVEKLKVAKYYGFEIDGNRRFLLGDFTVTHNTVLALNIVSRLNLKTLVVVHKEFLMNQWKERIEQFLPNAKVGKIQSRVVQKQNKDIVLGMLQSISMIDYDDDTFKDFGLVIFDECHHLGAEVFSRALLKTAVRYTLGLSATPKRNDGLSKVFEWYLGPIVYCIKKRDDNNVDVKIYHFQDTNPAYSKEILNYMKKPNTAQMINSICAYTRRLELVIKIIEECLNEGRKILVLSDRKNHLGLIKENLDTISHIKKDFNYTVGYYLGGMKAKDLEKTEKDNVILGTFSMASEGFDCREPLDTIILASPKSNIEQAVGRILRQDEKDRKFVPLIIDIVDEFSMFPRQALKRVKFYKQNKYKILTFDSDGNPIENIYCKPKKKKQSELTFIPDSD